MPLNSAAVTMLPEDLGEPLRIASSLDHDSPALLRPTTFAVAAIANSKSKIGAHLIRQLSARFGVRSFWNAFGRHSCNWEPSPACERWYRLQEQIPKTLPKRQDAVVIGEMSTQCTMTLFGVAIESHVLGKEMPECTQQVAIPLCEGQNGPEHALKPAVLITNEASGPYLWLKCMCRG